MNAEFIVLAESPISSQPCEAALDDPGQPNDLERSLLPFDDPEFVAVTPPQLFRKLPALVAGVSDDGPNFGEREARALPAPSWRIQSRFDWPMTAGAAQD